MLKAFKRAAESLEKLLDVTREELPGTMAAVRLSGMEISDLTMELSDLGLAFSFDHSYDVISPSCSYICRINEFPFCCSQEITQGVRNSTRAVRMAEERLRGLTNMTPPGYLRFL